VFDITARNNSAALAEMVEALQIPTIAITSAASSEAAADLLRAGADSVIMKPFTLDALDAHVEALRRRAPGAAGARPQRRYAYLYLTVDFPARRVTVGAQRIRLSAIQYHMLEFLCRHAGNVVGPSQLSDAVWGPGYEATPTLIRSHIRNLRRLLGDSASNPRFIRTERQIGYWMPRGEDEQV
jgi:DNA-binding response OmpR family regulator